MLSKETLSNLNIVGKNILKEDAEYSISNFYQPNSNEFSNFVLNSNLNNENIIK